MDSARETVLKRIRQAGSSSHRERASDHANIVRAYRRTAASSAESRFEIFAERLHDYGSAVERCTAPNISQAIARTLKARGLRRLIIPRGLSESWLPDGFEFIRDEGAPFEAIDSIGAVLTGCAVAIALTGTIVLRHSPAEGRRALTLLPDYHLCVVFEAQLVETVPEAIDRMSQFAPAPITTISGPSATSDIEMTRVKGVHGPRTLEVIFAAF